MVKYTKSAVFVFDSCDKNSCTICKAHSDLSNLPPNIKNLAEGNFNRHIMTDRHYKLIKVYDKLTGKDYWLG